MIDVVWASDKFGQWNKAHAITARQGGTSYSRLSLCNITPYNGWRENATLPHCKRCERILEGLMAAEVAE